MRRLPAAVVVLALLGGAGAARASDAAPPPRTLDDCDALARDHPKELSSYLCYWLVARGRKTWDDAARRLDARLAIEPSNHLAELYLGLIEADRRSDRARELFERAADGLAADGNATGEIYALISLAYHHQNRGNLPAAEAALARARRVAEASGDRNLLARTDWEEARQAFQSAEYGKAWALASRAESAIDETAPFDMRTGVLATLGATCWALGRHRDALGYFERQAEMLHAAGNLWIEAQARYNMAVIAGELLLEGGSAVDEVRGLVARALETAVAASNVWVESDVRLLMAQDPSIPLATRIEHLEWVLGREDKPPRIAEALRLLSALRLESDPSHPEKALELVDRAVALARECGAPLEIAQSAVARMAYYRAVGPRERAIEETLAALDAIERIRNLQRDPLVRARWFSEQAVHYYRAAGWLLGSEGGPPSGESLDLAFSIVERMRARALLDALDAARATPRPEPGDPRAAERESVLARIAEIQKRLVEGGLDAPAKASLLREIDGLETREESLREALASRDVHLAALARPRIPSIAEVRSLLAPDEALLAFQLSTRRVDAAQWRSNGGSWVIVVARDAAAAYPLPDADVLRGEIDVYLGTFARRDEVGRTAAVRLHDDLLKEALAALGPAVRRLVVVPDRDLHRLPFDALAAAPDGEPLASRFEISIVPSATLWARSRRSPPPDAGARALALADPALPSASAPAAVRQAAPWVDGLRLGPLPNARKEARRLASLLGSRCRFLEGAEASEHDLKHAPLGDVGVLVLATHAVVDEERPERSAVLLSPGAPEEDGLLQPREIAELPLEGKLVVLSSCGSATGTVLRGEGVVGIARSFMQAGARAVVASLWPMRDDEAAALAGSFYRHLSRGEAVTGALAAARRDRMRAGAPAAEWAGLVVLGDGDLVPFPGGAGSSALPAAALAGAAALAAVVVIRLWRRRQGARA